MDIHNFICYYRKILFPQNIFLRASAKSAKIVTYNLVTFNKVSLINHNISMEKDFH